MVDRKVYSDARPKVVYSLTESGRKFTEVVELLSDWSSNNKDYLDDLEKKQKNS